MLIIINKNRNYKELCKFNANDAIHTASMMSVYCITDGIKLIKEKIEIIILTGGGRKNLFIKKNLNKVLKHRNINVKNIEIFKYNGDMIEAQMFGYLAVRSLKKLPLSLPSTTGVIKAVSGGIKYGKLIKD